MKHFKLFIDESGHPHKNHASKYFALVGIIIEDSNQPELKVKADQLRFKYWDKTNVVFHSEEIGRKAGEFKKFASDAKMAEKFERQLFHFLHGAPFKIIAVVIDKDQAYKIGWTEETIITKAGESLIMDFLAFIYAQDNAQGRIVYEASGSTRDTLYLRAYHRFVDPNWEKAHPEFSKVREHITSITFAGKLNHDTETQIADILSYAAVCKTKVTKKTLSVVNGSYEARVINLLEKKLLQAPAGLTSKSKKKYYQFLRGVNLLPSAKPPTSKKKRTA